MKSLIRSARGRHRVSPKTTNFVAIKAAALGALATGAFSTGARAIGAFAVGAFAIGRLGIRGMAVKKLRIKTLEVEDLRVNRVPSMKAPIPATGFVLTHFLTVASVRRSARFYSEVLGGEVVQEGEPTVVKLANSWLILNVGGGPTDDKPRTVLHPPTTDREATSFLNIRVSNIAHYYQEWKSKGARFVTEPKDHIDEIRCYMKDPDGYLIEVGQTTSIGSEYRKSA